MNKLLGDKFLPESVATRRRSVRQSLSSIRNPVRNFRESTVPGPDVIGMTEDKILDFRDSFTTRDGLVTKLREMTGSDDESEDGGNSSDGEESSESDETTVSI